MTNKNEQIVAVLTTACVGLAGLAGSYFMYELLTAPLPVTASQGRDETAARGEVVGKCELLGICQEPKDSESGRRGN